MKHILILVPKKAILGSLEGSRQVFTQVNQFFIQQRQPPVFVAELVGLNAETFGSGKSYTVHAEKLLTDVIKQISSSSPLLMVIWQRRLNKTRHSSPKYKHNTARVQERPAFAWGHLYWRLPGYLMVKNVQRTGWPQTSSEHVSAGGAGNGKDQYR